MPAPIAVLLALAVAAAPAPADDAQFKTQREQAAKNAASDAGKKFDEALGKAINTSPDFAPKATACLRQFPGEQTVDGYFDFDANGGYRVVLRPDTGFARCFVQTLEGRSLPAPPQRPYLNPFSFSNHPVPKTVKPKIVKLPAQVPASKP